MFLMSGMLGHLASQLLEMPAPRRHSSPMMGFRVQRIGTDSW